MAVVPGADLNGPARKRPPGRMPLSAWSWALYEGGKDPYLILVSVYVFMPYFVTKVVGDPVAGQTLVASWGKVAGLAVAFTAPFLGAMVDVTGRRKPWLVVATLVAALLIASLWWVTPPPSAIPAETALLIITAIGIVYAYAEVLHNSLLHSAAGPRHAGRASGWALSLGAIVGVSVLAFVLVAFALPGKSALPFVPLEPLFGINQAAFEPDRIVAPIAAGLLVLLALPLFVFVTDGAPTGVPLRHAFVAGARNLGGLFRQFGRDTNILLFLIARALYADGTYATVLFLGIFAAGVMGWSAVEMLAFGIAQSICSALGGLIAGRLDGLVGPKTSAQLAIAGMIIAIVGLMGTSPTQIFYIWTAVPGGPALWPGPVFTSAPELAFLLCGGGVALFGTASASSSRTLLTQLAPPDRSGTYFGLYSLAGKATVWLGPWLVELFTRSFGTQQAGFAPVALLLALGLSGLVFVRLPRTHAAAP